MRNFPGTDAWLSPPDPKVPPSGEWFAYVERESDNEGGWVELEVVCQMDEGNVYAATVDGKPFDLTAEEIKRIEEDWALDASENPPERDEPERDMDR